MNSDQRIRLALERANHYYLIMLTVLLSDVILAGIIAFTGGGEARLALAAIIVGVGLYGVLGGDPALRDLANLRDSMDEETASTPYGKGAKASPIGAFRAISALVSAVLALALLLSLYGG